MSLLIKVALSPEYSEVPDFSIIVLIIFLSVMYGRSARMGTLSMVLLRLPSTAVHEMAHLFMSLVTFAGPNGFSVFPKRTPDGWILGSVECARLGMFNSFPVAMAPLLINIPIALWMFKTQNPAGYVCSFLFITSSVPSIQDLKVAIQSFLGFMVWLCGIAVGFLVWRGVW